MTCTKTCLVLSVLIAAACGKVVLVKNIWSGNLTLSANGVESTLLKSGVVSMDVTDSLVMTAIPENAEVTDGPKTTVKMTMGETTDSYAVYLDNGYNLPAKIIPKGGSDCSASVCAANIISACPAEDQVANSLGTVVACQNSPVVMKKLCSTAVVDSETEINVQSCTNATSYIVMI